MARKDFVRRHVFATLSYNSAFSRGLQNANDSSLCFFSWLCPPFFRLGLWFQSFGWGVRTRADDGLVPYGAVVQLDPALDLSTLGLSLPAR